MLDADGVKVKGILKAVDGNDFTVGVEEKVKVEGAFVEVEDDGHLILHDKKGVIRSYAFGEIKFLVNSL